MGTEDADRPERFLGRLLGGSYTPVRLLGAGAMGAVFEARQADGGRCAVKLVHPHLLQQRELIERFLREAKLGNSIESPHVVPVVDSGQDPDGTLFLVMPFLYGYDVAELLQRTGPVDPATAVRLAMQACLGLVAAHQRGIVHRDIKPSNLFLDHTPDRVVVRVCDFGVAKRLEMYDDSNLTHTGTSMGSPLYMAPEQVVSAKHVDERSDIWGLGATLYELLCGMSPYGDATSISDLMVMICTRNAPSIQQRAPWVEPTLALVVHQALHREPSERYQSASELLAALQAISGTDSSLAERQLCPASDELRAYRAPAANLARVAAPDGPVSIMPSMDPGQAGADPVLGRTIDGKYRVRRLLGRGGMGSVYEAVAPDQQRVAVKIISSELARSGDEGYWRFVREARAAISIAHPNVVATIDAGTDDERGDPYIVMELLRGVDLQALLRRQGALPPHVLVRIIVQAARGIGAAHAQGLVHRDVKPANLFLSTQIGQQEVTVKVCDFGVAKRYDLTGDDETQGHDLTRTGGMLGSPMYMSPEQAQNAKTVGPQSDVWSLAVALYEGLSSRNPWGDTQTLGQLIVAICTAPVPWLQDHAPWIDPGLAEVVHRGLERDPSQRYASMDEFVAALDPYLEGTDTVLREDLRGLDVSERAAAAPRAAQTAALSTMGQSGVSTSSPVRTGRPALMAFAAMGALAMVGVGAGLTWRWTRPTAPATEPSRSAEPQPAAAYVVVEPRDALVRVDGKRRELDDGTLELRGLPGDDFTVRVERGDQVETVNVVITRDGKASPDVIELPEPERTRQEDKGASEAPSAPTVPKPIRAAPPAAPARSAAPVAPGDPAEALVNDEFR